MFSKEGELVVTTPPHGDNNHEEGKDNDDLNSQQPPEYPEYPQYPQYPSTPHPEDAPDYGTQGAQGYQSYPGYPASDQSQGYQPYGAQPQPQAPYGGGTGFGNQVDSGLGGLNPNMVATDGKINVLRALKWGVSKTFSNAAVFILGTLAVGVLSAVIGVVLGPVSAQFGGSLAGVVLDIVMTLISAAWMVFVVRLMIWQVDKVKAGYGDLFKDVHFSQGFITSIVVSLIQGLIVGVPLMLWVANSGFSPTSLNTPEGSQAFLAESSASMFAFLGGLLVLALLITPLFMFPVEFATESRAGIGGAIAQAFQVGKRNYGTLLLYNLVIGIVATIIIVVTLGLGALVVVPALMLTQTHMYRQGAGGPIPHDPEHDGPLGGHDQNPDNYGGYQGFA